MKEVNNVNMQFYKQIKRKLTYQKCLMEQKNVDTIMYTCVFNFYYLIIMY